MFPSTNVEQFLPCTAQHSHCNHFLDHKLCLLSHILAFKYSSVNCTNCTEPVTHSCSLESEFKRTASTTPGSQITCWCYTSTNTVKEHKQYSFWNRQQHSSNPHNLTFQDWLKHFCSCTEKWLTELLEVGLAKCASMVWEVPKQRYCQAWM